MTVRATKPDNVRHDVDTIEERSVWVHVARQLLKFACSHGLRREDLFPQEYLQKIESGAPYHRVPLNLVHDMVEYASQHVEHFGIRAAKVHNSWNEHVVGFLMSTSATFGAAFDNTTRFRRILMDSDRLTLVRGTKEARFIFQPSGPMRPAHAQFCEFLFYQLAIGSQAILGRPFDILKIRFRHTAGDAETFLQQTFSVPLEFGAPIDELIAPIEVLDLPLPSNNPKMRDFFEAHAKEMLERLPVKNQIRERLRAWVIDHLGDGDVSVPHAAEALGMSARTLQRQLRREGASMHQLVDDIRREYALVYLEASSNVAEVAYRLGYSEPSAFHRAFKRWTGITPRRYLEHRASGG